MAILPLTWKAGDGQDVHVLRGGPPSRSLIDAFELPPSELAASLFFIPQFEGAPSAHFMEVDPLTGAVQARPHTDATAPKLNNFLMTASFVPSLDPAAQEYRTEIRVHVHDSVTEIWLTPATLPVHVGADAYRFTVLARFDDLVVGDITDWPGLAYRSAEPGAVRVLSGGILQAVVPGRSEIVATLEVPTLSLSKTSPPATAVAKPAWADVAAAANVVFVAGPVVPNPGDAAGGARDSVRSVVERATNVLFVADGFRQPRRGDFNNLVGKVTEELRTKAYLQPFSLLKGAVNYWSVFVPSEEDGVSLLSEHALAPNAGTAEEVPPPQEPPASATGWSVEQMIHEVGLPVPWEVETPWLPDHVRRWQRLYGAKVTEDRTRGAYGEWVNLALRTPLNERGSAFGMAVGRRPRASRHWRDATLLHCDRRRSSQASLMTFVAGLRYGGHPIGATWQRGGKDFGLVCVVCLTDRNAGQATLGEGYVTASFGRSAVARVEGVPGRGWDVRAAPPERHSRTVFASVVAHECGHVLGLWDEYGDARGTALADAAAVAPYPNVEAKSRVTTTVTDPATHASTTVYDKIDDLRWLWPRLTKAGIVTGTLTRAESGFRVPLRPGHGQAFRAGDVVRFREWPVRERPSADPFAAFHQSSGLVARVKAAEADAVRFDLEDAAGQVVDVDAPNPANPDPRSWTDIVRGLFRAGTAYVLVCPRMQAGVELRLVAEPVLAHIRSKNGPLNAPLDDPGAACVAASSISSTMTPTNLPALSRRPRTLADIVGIYEGASYHDCGVFRPAGRCKMRSGYRKLVPFCHVCRYLLVDRVDPTRHGALDAVYEREYPQA